MNCLLPINCGSDRPPTVIFETLLRSPGINWDFKCLTEDMKESCSDSGGDSNKQSNVRKYND